MCAHARYENYAPCYPLLLEFTACFLCTYESANVVDIHDALHRINGRVDSWTDATNACTRYQASQREPCGGQCRLENTTDISLVDDVATVVPCLRPILLSGHEHSLYLSRMLVVLNSEKRLDRD